jgi:hypothetical protein
VAQPKFPAVDLAQERAERAARIAAMFDRWAAEDVSGEPDWDVEEFAPLNMTRTSSGLDPALSEKL